MQHNLAECASRRNPQYIEQDALEWQRRVIAYRTLSRSARALAQVIACMARDGVCITAMPLLSDLAGLHLKTGYLARARLSGEGLIAMRRTVEHGWVIDLVRGVKS